MMGPMDDLVQFLRARLDDDAAAARRAGDSFRQIGETGVIVATEGDRAEECASANWAGIADHIVRHDPARVLAEVDAKRRIVAYAEQRAAIKQGEDDDDWENIQGTTLETVLRALALPYAEHPDYKDEWRP